MFGWIDKRRSRSYMPVGDVADYEEQASPRKHHRVLQIALCIGIAMMSLSLGYFIGGGRGPLSQRDIVGRTDLSLQCLPFTDDITRALWHHQKDIPPQPRLSELSLQRLRGRMVVSNLTYVPARETRGRTEQLTTPQPMAASSQTPPTPPPPSASPSTTNSTAS